MNKFLILIAAFLSIYQVSTAQTEKGNQTVGFNVSYSGSSFTDNVFSNTGYSFSKIKTTFFTLGPLYSYFIADRVDMGASFSLNSYTTNTNSPNSSITEYGNHNKSYEALMYVRKYFLYANKIGVRTGPYVGYTWADQGYGNQDSRSDNLFSQKSHGYEAGAKLEAVYFPSKRLGVSAMIANFQYEHFKGKNSSSAGLEQTNGNNINFSFINSGLALSLFYVFGK